MSYKQRAQTLEGRIKKRLDKYLETASIKDEFFEYWTSIEESGLSCSKYLKTEVPYDNGKGLLEITFRFSNHDMKPWHIHSGTTVEGSNKYCFDYFKEEFLKIANRI